MLDATEKYISEVLTKHKATPLQIETYLEDIFAFSNIDLYKEADEQTIINDFNEWLED